MTDTEPRDPLAELEAWLASHPWHSVTVRNQHPKLVVVMSRNDGVTFNRAVRTEGETVGSTILAALDEWRQIDVDSLGRPIKETHQ